MLPAMAGHTSVAEDPYPKVKASHAQWIVSIMGTDWYVFMEMPS